MTRLRRFDGKRGAPHLSARVLPEILEGFAESGDQIALRHQEISRNPDAEGAAYLVEPRTDRRGVTLTLFVVRG
jgi:hypothetical protein